MLTYIQSIKEINRTPKEYSILYFIENSCDIIVGFEKGYSYSFGLGFDNIDFSYFLFT